MTKVREPHLEDGTRVVLNGGWIGNIVGCYRGTDGTGREVWRYQIRCDRDHPSHAFHDSCFEYGFRLISPEEEALLIDKRNKKWWKLW